MTSAGVRQECLLSPVRAYGMEVSMEIMVNSTTNTSTDVTMNGEKLEEVTSLKYLESCQRMVPVLLRSI
ncbi:hypothetical protein DPMN_153598 [Dreissena polymorpha]|uniref:Uncharacterized protein n=1 Tax=Dreissena polymorpha TaxID=45954 RepID=A0A9D4FIX0_DREPO|nr:hypothetical protein DPMN_153598 [Dreissena polymorpha]